MSIPLNFSPLGFTLTPSGELPAGYTRLAFLESSGGEYIDTQHVPNDETGLLIEQQQIIGGDTIPFGARENGSTNTRFYVMRAPAVAYATLGYGWGYWMWVEQKTAFPGVYETTLNYQNSRLATGAGYTRDLSQLSITFSVSLYLFAANIAGQPDLLWGGRIFAAAISQGESVVREYIPAINPSGEPGMFDKITQTFFANDGDGAFTAGIETLDQLTALASNLPTVTDTPEIKLSLPAAFETDATAQGYIEQAEAKGWVVTVSEWRASESDVATADLLSEPVIYCRAVESEAGNYEKTDGSRWYVETCVAIYHPEGLTPEELGYDSAENLDAFLVENGLTAVVYEEEMEETT